MSNIFDKLGRQSRPAQNVPKQKAPQTPEQYFSGVVGEARKLQGKYDDPRAEAQRRAQELMQSGKLNQAQFNRMYGIAQMIASRFGGK